MKKTDLTKKTKPKKQQEELQDERHETPIIFFFLYLISNMLWLCRECLLGNLPIMLLVVQYEMDISSHVW